MNNRRRHDRGQRAETHKAVHAARCADGGGMNHFRVKLDKQIVWEQGLADRSTFTTDDFFQRDRRHQAIDCLTFKVFLGALKLPTFAIK